MITLNKILDTFSKALDNKDSYAAVTRIHRNIGPYKRCTTVIKKIDASNSIEDVVEYTSDSKKVYTEDEPAFTEENELKALKDFFTLIINNKL